MQSDLPVEKQVGYLVKRLQQQIRAAMDDRLSRHGVSMATYAALAVLEHEPGLSNAELARRCFVTPQTMNAVIKGLGDTGIVERRSHPDHGRILQTRLTDRGRDLIATCHQEVDAVHTRMLAALNATEQALLTDFITRCVEALDT